MSAPSLREDGFPAPDGPCEAEALFIRRGTPLYRRASFSLLLGALTTFNLLYCVQPVMPLFSRSFGVGADQAALSLSLSTAMLACALLVAAPLADRFGRKPVMLVSMFLSSGLVLAGSLLDGWSAFLVTRALLGLALGGLPAIAMTYLAEEIEPAALSATMSLYIGGNALGGVLGRLMNGVLADLFSWRVSLAVTGVLGLLGSVLMWRLLPRSRVFVPLRRRERASGLGYARLLRNPFVLLLLAEGGLLSGILVTASNLLGYHLIAEPFRLSVGLTSLIFVSYLLGMPTTVVGGRIAERAGRGRVLKGGLLLIIVGVALMSSGSLTVIAVGLAVLVIGFFAAHSSASTLITAGPEAKAQLASLYMFAFYAGSGLISWFGGHVWTWGQWPAVSLYLATLAILGLSAAAALPWARRRAEPSHAGRQ